MCTDQREIESGLHSAFFPNYGCDYSLSKHPFEHGGIATIAGALCFYLVKKHAFLDGNKRTAAITTTVFLDVNSYSLCFLVNDINSIDEFATIIERCAASEITKEELMTWFDLHTVVVQT